VEMGLDQVERAFLPSSRLYCSLARGAIAGGERASPSLMKTHVVGERAQARAREGIILARSCVVGRWENGHLHYA